MKTKFSEGWDEERVKRVLEPYEHGSNEEAVAEEGAEFEFHDSHGHVCPSGLVPAVRELLPNRQPS